MIRVILQGRTGNNLFQYAAGRALAHRHHTELILDGAWADAHHARQFEHLLRLPIAARYERRLTLLKRAGSKLFKRGPAQTHRGPVLIDTPGAPPADLGSSPDGTLLVGFFQSARHFAGIEDDLRRELDLTQLAIPPAALRFEESLRATLTVSIHVRRGDYLHIGSTQCLGEGYHDRAIHWFRNQFENLRFCVFSDDIPWCRSRFQGSEFLFSDFPEAASDPFLDMRLMAACHHHIIVNSSYSWWGAWLERANGTTLAPARWMTGLTSESIIPHNWKVIN